KSFCTSEEHEHGKLTTPSFSGGGCSCSCADNNIHPAFSAIHDEQRRNARLVRITVFVALASLLVIGGRRSKSIVDLRSCAVVECAHVCVDFVFASASSFAVSGNFVSPIRDRQNRRSTGES